MIDRWIEILSTKHREVNMEGGENAANSTVYFIVCGYKVLEPLKNSFDPEF